MDNTEKFRQLIEGSSRILITSHTSPDPDAVASVLLLGTTLKENFPNKKVEAVLEEEPEGLDFLTGYQDIEFSNLFKALEMMKPDLFIMLDAVNYERCSRTDGQLIRKYVSDNNIKSAIIDHHEPAGKDEADAYIYQGSIATAQDVYEVCFDNLALRKPNGSGETTMAGIYSDSGGFTYSNPRHQQTLAIVNQLLDEGVDLEVLKNNLNQYSQPQMKALAELIRNLSGEKDYSYSFLDDEYVANWQADNNSMSSLNTIAGYFVNEFIRNSGGRKWGFIVYKNPLAGEGMYSVSFRSQSGVKDVSQIANKLGGGGHKPAAGAKINAKSITGALLVVKETISNS